MYYDSYHKHYANQEFSWIGYDSLILYKTNLKVKPDVLAANGWIDYPPLSYKFNHHGFRSAEFTETPNIVFLGCSFTLGVGMQVERTWPTLVSDQLKLTCYNLGQAGGSGDTAFRLGQYWIPKLNPAIVVYSLPPINRVEVVLKQGFKGYMPNKSDHLDQFYKTWLDEDANSMLNQQKNLLALRELCKHTKFVSLDVLDMPDAFVDLARDLTHSGTKSNQNIAKFVLEQI